MCRAIADGGQRCAACTRPAYEGAVLGSSEWDRAAAEYAATPSGRTALMERRDTAEAEGQVEEVVACETALAAGERLRAVSAETRNTVRSLIAGGPSVVEAPKAPVLDWRGRPLPLVEGSEPLDVDELGSAFATPEWLTAWNDTPREARRPIVFYHASTSPNPEWEGYLHAGDQAAAFMRAFNVGFGIDQGDGDDTPPMYLHAFHYRGDLHTTVVPDSVANYCASAMFANDVFEAHMVNECAEAGYETPDDVDRLITDTQAVVNGRGCGVLYVNNSEYIEYPSESIMFHARTPGWETVTVEQVFDEDERWELVS